MRAIDSQFLRNGLGCFATGIATVTTRRANGSPVAVTINSFSSLSMDPPLVQWNLDSRSTALEAFKGAPGFLVHILAAHQDELSKRFSRQGEDRWNGVEYDEGVFGLPRLRGAHATIECALHDVLSGGDHQMFLGRVLRVDTDVDARPLVFYRGRYHQLAADSGP